MGTAIHSCPEKPSSPSGYILQQHIFEGIYLQDSSTCMEIRGFAVGIFLLIKDPKKDLQFSKTFKLLQS